MTEEIIREYHVGEFRGNYPEVPIAAGVDLEALKELDASPFYATLPIAEVGATSKNGLLYDEALVNSIAEQINQNRPGGIFGHLKDEDRDTSFPLPSGMWVGAQRDGNTLWGKAYLPNGPAREHIRTLKALGGQIATSIYGKGKFEKLKDGVRRLTDFKLESLDFAPPSRAALGMGAIPYVTAEMEQEQEPEMDKAQVIAELTVADIPDKLRESIVAEAIKQDEATQTIAELTEAKEAQDTIIAELKTQIEAQQKAAFEATLDAQVAELTAWDVSGDDGKRKLDALRAMLKNQILSALGEERKAERVAEVAQAAWDVLEPIAETIRDALAGPSAIVNGRVRETSLPALEDTPENRNKALSSMGINI